MDAFGRRLENLRDKTGDTKKEVSTKLGFTDNVYGSYERGEKRPSFESLAKLSDMYNVSIDYLIRGKEFQDNRATQERFKKLEALIDYFHSQAIDKPFILQLDKWQLLDHEDLQELNNYFEWVVHKAKKRQQN